MKANFQVSRSFEGYQAYLGAICTPSPNIWKCLNKSRLAHENLLAINQQGTIHDIRIFIFFSRTL